MKYEAYIHTNGKIQLKRMVFGESTIDISSPFVEKYLGTIEANSPEEAKEYFENMRKS